MVGSINIGFSSPTFVTNVTLGNGATVIILQDLGTIPITSNKLIRWVIGLIAKAPTHFIIAIEISLTTYNFDLFSITASLKYFLLTQKNKIINHSISSSTNSKNGHKCPKCPSISALASIR